ncbi:MAG: hypothetical protein QOC61_2014 [Acidobacteriota bacterium]|nr:hypothetical protein [Acidobacteriota bacterium]MDT5263010.1 hypothetical protein [Acidobacteriota bacterium]
MTDCKACLGEIEEATEAGVLSRGARSHVESCNACGDILRERESLRRLVGGLRKIEAPPDFEFRLRARMAETKAAGRRGPFGGLQALYSLAPVAAAACFLIVSASLYLWTAPRTSPVPASNDVVNEKAQNSGNVQSNELRRQETPAPSVFMSEGVNGGAHSRLASNPQTVILRPHGGVRPAMEVLPRLNEGMAAASNTLTAGLNSAPVITARTWKISVGTNAEPLRMIVRDEHGAERVVPMRTVSFGSQELIAREGARQRTAVADDEGVW